MSSYLLEIEKYKLNGWDKTKIDEYNEIIGKYNYEVRNTNITRAIYETAVVKEEFFNEFLEYACNYIK